MKYTEVTLHIHPLEPARDLLVYSLGDEGAYDSFVETADGLKAYVPTADYDETFLLNAIAESNAQVSYEVSAMPDKDWNIEWEKNHQAIMVEDFAYVRAPFHEPHPEVKHEIIIEPKMAFGTAHHATTYMMLCNINEAEVEGRTVLDMGSGTGVLAIMAAQCGASRVVAIDIDDWAVKNAEENISVNGCEQTVECLKGDADLLTSLDARFDIVLANINRNILLADMSRYVTAMKPEGKLMLSGFYEADEAVLTECAEQLGLHKTGTRHRGEWSSLVFQL